MDKVKLSSAYGEMKSYDKYLMSMDELVTSLLHDVELCRKEEKLLKDRGNLDSAMRWYETRRAYEVLLWRIGVNPNGQQ